MSVNDNMESLTRKIQKNLIKFIGHSMSLAMSKVLEGPLSPVYEDTGADIEDDVIKNGQVSC